MCAELPTWAAFEHRVCDALEAAGYAVEHDRLLAGSQVDVYAELVSPLHIHRLIVECKESSTPVSVKDVRQLSALVNAESTPEEPINGLLVAAAGFSRNAKKFGERAGIALMTLDQLESISFDPSPIAEHVRGWYENDELARCYVDLSCWINEDGHGTVYKPVEKFLDRHLASTKRAGVAVLGNFGSGKTSLCKHYAYLLAMRWLSRDGRSFLPIYINLRDLRDLLTIEDDLLAVLATIYGVHATKEGLVQ